MARARSAPEPAGGLSLVIDRAALAQALASVIKAVATSVQIPILTNLLLAAEGGTLAITGTNLDQQATLRVPATVQGAGAFTVYGQAVHDLARRLAGDAVTIALAPDGHAVTIAAGRSRSTLPTLPVADFPDIAAFRGGGPAYAVEIAGSVLADLFGRCAFAISTEETRYYLCGVLAHAVERDGVPVLRLVATDGRRLARIDAPRATGADLRMPKAILPAKAVALFTAAAKAAGDAMLRLETTPTTARLILPTGEIVTKLIDGTFPNYDAVTPTTFAREAATATLALAQALDRAGALSEEKDRRVRLDFEADRIGIVLPHQADGTTSSDEVEAELSGDPLSIGFNTRYLSEILTLSNVDKVTIRLGADAQQAAVITDRSGDAVYILMPMRI